MCLFYIQVPFMLKSRLLLSYHCLFLPLPLQCYSDPTHNLRNYLDSEGYITVKISGSEGAVDSNFYKIHPEIKKYKYGVVQPGMEWDF